MLRRYSTVEFKQLLVFERTIIINHDRRVLNGRREQEDKSLIYDEIVYGSNMRAYANMSVNVVCWRDSIFDPIALKKRQC